MRLEHNPSREVRPVSKLHGVDGQSGQNKRQRLKSSCLNQVKLMLSLQIKSPRNKKENENSAWQGAVEAEC